MAELRIEQSITRFNREAWNACFLGEIEDYDHYVAIEKAGIKGFEWRYLAMCEGEKILAATAAFITHYELDTTLQGFWKKPVGAIKKICPKLFALSLACIGSPETECGYLGFHPSVDEQMQRKLLTAMLVGFENMAQELSIKLIGAKDIPDHQRTLWDASAVLHGYKRINSLPTGILELKAQTFDDYLATLSKVTRKNMRRKLKEAESITVEQRHHLGNLTPAVMEMYYDTKNRSDWQFEELTAEYFTGAHEHMGNRALSFIYYAEGKPVGFNFVLLDEKRMIDKFFCMKGEEGRQYNLYFVSWMNNIKYCIEHGIKTYQSGQAGYETKLRLGSSLILNWLYFKHRNPLVHAILKLFAPLLEVEIPTHA